MLVLTRYEKQALLIPEYDVSVVVCRIDGNRVRIGIQAPDGVAIIREELMDRYEIYPRKKRTLHGDGDGSPK